MKWIEELHLRPTPGRQVEASQSPQRRFPKRVDAAQPKSPQISQSPLYVRPRGILSEDCAGDDFDRRLRRPPMLRPHGSVERSVIVFEICSERRSEDVTMLFCTAFAAGSQLGTGSAPHIPVRPQFPRTQSYRFGVNNVVEFHRNASASSDGRLTRDMLPPGHIGVALLSHRCSQLAKTKV